MMAGSNKTDPAAKNQVAATFRFTGWGWCALSILDFMSVIKSKITSQMHTDEQAPKFNL